jgi:hypothetical protein
MGILVLGCSSVSGSLQETLDHGEIDRRIDKIQPTRKEKRFEEIGWVKGLREGERLARKNGRPLFLFSNVGEMGLGRC